MIDKHRHVAVDLRAFHCEQGKVNMRIVTGIDTSADRFAFGRIGNKFISSGYVERRSKKKEVLPEYPYELRKFVKAHTKYEDDPLIVVEGAYAHRNIGTFAALHAVVSEIQFVCCMYRVACVVVQPREWQPFMLPGVKQRSEFLKAASIKSAKLFTKTRDLTEHECDAINIARYGRKAYGDYYG